MVSRKEFDEATARAKERRLSGPTAVSAKYNRSTRRISVALDTGIEVIFPADRAEGLAQASPSDLTEIEVTPSGLGLHFPKLDADIYLPALLEGVLGSRSWIAASLGKKGGSSRSTAKAAASRKNGKLGGRPRKPRDRKAKLRTAGRERA